MELESVFYSYSDAELALLAALLSCGDIPLLALPAAHWEEAMKALREDRLVSENGSELVVDEISAFLVRSLGECRRYLCLRGVAAFCGLFHTEYADIVLSQRDGRCLIAPFSGFAPAQRFFLEKLLLTALPGTLELRNKKGCWRCESQETQAVLSLQGQLPDLVCGSKIPDSGGELFWTEHRPVLDGENAERI